MKENKEKFKELYGIESNNESFCPYRVCPVGAHSDHQYGHVTGFAIDKGVHVLYNVNDDENVRVASANFEGMEYFKISAIKSKEDDWADYVRGATKVLYDEFKITKGIDALIIGTMPIGGLSSSAAVIIAFMNALCRANNIRMEPSLVIKLALRVENEFIGVSVGTLDQSCEMYSKKEALLYLDTKDGSYEIIPQSKDMPPYEFAIFFSGVERTLVGSAFNMRVDEMKSAAYDLMAFSDMPYGKFAEARLRNVPEQIFEQYKDKLPVNFRKRATHFYTEMDRVEKFKTAWSEGNIVECGKIMFASGDSSIYNYETGSDELKTLSEIAHQVEGIYGGRFSGAGFKGSYVALVNPEYEDTIRKEVTRMYLEKFPEYKDKFGVFFCKTADGCDFK